MTIDENVKKTIAPLSVDLIKEYFSNKELFFIIDYSESKIKERVLLTYLANLNLPCDIHFSEDVTSEDILSLLKAYMSSKTINDVRCLNSLTAIVLFRAKGAIDPSNIDIPYLNIEEVDEFIEANSDLINRWVTFLDSTIYFLIYSSTELREAMNIEESLEKIEDPDYIGLNVVNLFKIPGFYNNYLSCEVLTEPKFFTAQFKEPMFKGSTFIKYFDTEENIMIPILLGLIDGDLPTDADDIEKMVIGEIDG